MPSRAVQAGSRALSNTPGEGMEKACVCVSVRRQSKNTTNQKQKQKQSKSNSKSKSKGKDKSKGKNNYVAFLEAPTPRRGRAGIIYFFRPKSPSVRGRARLKSTFNMGRAVTRVIGPACPPPRSPSM
eukprot:881356-Pyramimonas_sp.AAC.1